jgi:biotin carboxyl carrier protein
VANDDGSLAERAPQDRLDDHAAIDRLADELVPALVAKLGANGLGELEVREGTWRVRLRMPADGPVAAGRRATTGRGGARAADASRGEHARGEHARGEAAAATGVGHSSVPADVGSESAPAAGPSRLIATSPAVGYFRPRAELHAGTKVRAGDRIGTVDVLGIAQDLVAPGDGLIGATLVAAGEPVEYGQAVIILEQLGEPRPCGAGTAAAENDAPAPAAAENDAPAPAAAEGDAPGDRVPPGEADASATGAA